MDDLKQGQQSTTAQRRQNIISMVLGGLLAIFGVAMLIIGILYGVGYWQAGDPAARWLLFGVGVGGAAYIFVRTGKAVRRSWQ